jgi:hypothetical protein
MAFPQFCVSIAYERRGRLELAVVYDALKRELFVAARGRGARLNGRPIQVSATPSLDRALLATAFPYDQRERRNFYLTFWEAFMMRTQGVRHTGYTVLDPCYVACGRVDALWEFGTVGRRGGGADRRRGGRPSDRPRLICASLFRRVARRDSAARHSTAHMAVHPLTSCAVAGAANHLPPPHCAAGAVDRLALAGERTWGPCRFIRARCHHLLLRCSEADHSPSPHRVAGAADRLALAGE